MLHLVEFRIVWAFAAALCFATTTVAFRLGHDTGDQRYAAFAFMMLAMGYLFMMTILGGSLAYVSVVISALTQILALGYAFAWLNEPVTNARVLGIVFSLAAIVAFSFPSNSNT